MIIVPTGTAPFLGAVEVTEGGEKEQLSPAEAGDRLDKIIVMMVRIEKKRRFVIRL